MFLLTSAIGIFIHINHFLGNIYNKLLALVLHLDFGLGNLYLELGNISCTLFSL